MSDYAGYVLLGSVLAALACLERLKPASRGQRIDWLNNATAWLLTGLSHTLLIGVLAVGETGLVNGLGGGLVDLRHLPWPVAALVYFVAMDLGEYLFHRAQHAVPALWAMHSLHHSDRAMSIATTQRHFWLEPAIKSATIWLAVAVLFRTDPAILAVYVLLSLGHFLTHSNIRLGLGPLSWAFNSPQYHRLHHSVNPAHHNANFAALLPIFDVLSGAYHRPKPGEYPATGLEEAVGSPLDVFVWPVRGRLRRSLSAGAAASATNH